MIVLAYRVLLEYAGKVMNFVLALGREYPFAVGVWFFILFTLACIVGWLVKKEPFISGSGIPQVEGEMAGKLNQVWWRVLPAKFLGGFLSLFAGLSLEEGPVDSDWSNVRKSGFQPAWKRKNRRKIFDYLWSKCRTCRSISCTACRCDVFIRRDT